MIGWLIGDPAEQIVGIVLLLVWVFIICALSFWIHDLVSFIKIVLRNFALFLSRLRSGRKLTR